MIWLIMLIRIVFQVKRTMDVHIKAYTITADRPRTCVLIPLRNICDFSVISKGLNYEKNGDTNNKLLLLYNT